MLSIPPKQLQDLLHAQLPSATLSTLNRLIGKLALLFLQVQDPLLDAVLYGDFVDDYVDFLGEAMDAVDCLFFYELWIVRKIVYEMGEEGIVVLTGFQKGSRITTRVAAVRFRPREPHLRLQSRTLQLLSLRSSLRLASRRSFFMLPS